MTSWVCYVFELGVFQVRIEIETARLVDHFARQHKLLRLAIALAMSFALSACDLQGGDKSRDALWQVEVNAVSMAVHADAATEGSAEAFDSLRASRDAVEAVLGSSESKPLPAEIGAAWLATRQIADVILSHQEAFLTTVKAEAEFAALVPLMTARIDEIGRSLIDSSDQRASARQVYLLGRLQMLLERMQRRIGQVRSGGNEAISAADAYVRDSAVSEQTLAGLQLGNEELGIEAIASPEANALLIEVRQRFAEARAVAEPLFSASADLFETREAAAELPGAVAELQAELQRARRPRE